MSDLHWQSNITKIEPNRISVKGYALDKLMGQVSFAHMVYLLFKGELPSDEMARLIEAILVSSVDHGTTPPSVLSALTVASTGAPLNAAVAAGILAISKFHGGAIEDCMRSLQEGVALRRDKDLSPSQAAETLVREAKANQKRLSGFGHRLHTRDPRTKKLFELADKAGISGEFIEMAAALEKQLAASSGKDLPINVDGAIAAVLCEIGIDPMLANGFFMVARVPGLIAHIYEEKTRYRPMRRIHPTDVGYDGPDDR